MIVKHPERIVTNDEAPGYKEQGKLMKLNGEQILPCAPDKAWELLMDPKTLQACIPGCESLSQEADDKFSAVVSIKIGPVKAKFKGEVELSDLNPPHTCRISGKGTGGLAGFAQGGAAIQLSEHEEGTLLVYDVDAQVGGKLAQLGARLIDSTAKKLALEFFDQLQEQITERA